MSIDGVVIGIDQGWDPTLYSKRQVLAHLPMLLDRNIKHTLNPGVATGSTIKTLSRYN